ncbi:MULTISPECIES: hypothetical protein [unclassified Haloparvum]|uniref:hypothetical protein n=1 Tax=Haloparvum sp. PAK95 TaxID=3418962 RepID=UPI003D2F2B93
MEAGGRSAYWDEVATLVEQSRGRFEEFDPETGDAQVPITEGVVPIVELYVEVRRDDVTLSQVERSLIEGLLNDWLNAYARAHDTSCPGEFSVHDVVLAFAEAGSLEDAVHDLTVDWTRRPGPA